MPRNTCIYGIDTSILIRLITGHPESEYLKTIRGIERLLNEIPSTGVVVSNQVIGESYIVLQLHYKIPKADARKALLKVLEGGVFRPMNGNSALECLHNTGGCGLVDRLVADEYGQQGMQVLTNDRKMSRLSNGQLLSAAGKA